MPDVPHDARIHTTVVQMRFADTDALGHVNNGSYVVYVETGRLEFLKLLGGAVRSLILAHLSVDFRRQVTFGAAIAVDTWVERIGTSSVTLRQHVRADGVMAAEARSVVVYFDYEAQRPRPWTDALRAALARHLIEPEDAGGARA